MITIAVGPRFCNAYRCLPYKPSVFGRTWVASPCGYVLCAICGPNSFRWPLLLDLECRFSRPHRVLCHRLLACIQSIINYTPCCCCCQLPLLLAVLLLLLPQLHLSVRRTILQHLHQNIFLQNYFGFSPFSGQVIFLLKSLEILNNRIKISFVIVLAFDLPNSESKSDRRSSKWIDFVRACAVSCD